MLWLGLFGVAFVGTLFWVASPEVAAALYASKRSWNPLVIGILAASGQLAAQALLFAFGDQLRRRWAWFDRQCGRVRARYQARLEKSATVVVTASGLLGVPPGSVTAALAPGLGLRAVEVLPLLFATRVVRFTVVAALAARVSGAPAAGPAAPSSARQNCCVADTERPPTPGQNVTPGRLPPG